MELGFKVGERVFLLDAGFVNWKWWFNNGKLCFFFMGND